MKLVATECTTGAPRDLAWMHDQQISRFHINNNNANLAATFSALSLGIHCVIYTILVLCRHSRPISVSIFPSASQFRSGLSVGQNKHQKRLEASGGFVFLSALSSSAHSFIHLFLQNLPSASCHHLLLLHLHLPSCFELFHLVPLSIIFSFILFPANDTTRGLWFDS